MGSREVAECEEQPPHTHTLNEGYMIEYRALGGGRALKELVTSTYTGKPREKWNTRKALQAKSDFDHFADLGHHIASDSAVSVDVQASDLWIPQMSERILKICHDPRPDCDCRFNVGNANGSCVVRQAISTGNINKISLLQ
jgi:hypothetical protein